MNRPHASPLALASMAILAAAGVSCSGQVPSNGLETEPLQISNGQFFAGELPGAPPIVVPDGGFGDAGAPMPSLAITDTAVPILPVVSGASGELLGGHVTQNAASVAVRFPDLGTGYWIVPVGPIDATSNGDRSFGFKANFNPGDPAGTQTLRFVGIDAAGNAGTQDDAQICLSARIPDNGHACHPDNQLPPLVISLAWDSNFDLDLHVIDPSGKDLNSKAAGLEAVEAGVLPSSAPHFDRDSMRGCLPDGFRQEDLIFPTPPAPGYYLIYADPFASCGQAATRFTMTVYKAEGVCPGCLQEPLDETSGELLASQVTGGAMTGLFVTTYTAN